MLSAFLKGILGWALQAGAVIFFLLAVAGGSPIGPTLVICAIMLVAGAYLTFVSRHTVRTK